MLRPIGEAGQECYCWNATVLPQCRVLKQYQVCLDIIYVLQNFQCDQLLYVQHLKTLKNDANVNAMELDFFLRLILY